MSSSVGLGRSVAMGYMGLRDLFTLWIMSLMCSWNRKS